MSRDDDFLRPEERRTSGTDQTVMMMRYDNEKKSVLLAYLLWFFLGWFGVHRMYLGSWVSGLIMLALNGISTALVFLLVGYLGYALLVLWLLLDLFLIPGMVRRRNEELIGRLTR